MSQYYDSISKPNLEIQIIVEGLIQVVQYNPEEKKSNLQIFNKEITGKEA